jgi:hypothetical protein
LPSGRIEPTPQNIQGMGQVLGKMTLRDFE